MVTNRKLNKMLVAMLSVSMLATSIPMNGIVAYANTTSAADQTVTFDTEQDRGGWVKDDRSSGGATIAFTNGQMILDSATGGETYFKFGNAPLKADGYIEMDVTLTQVDAQKAGRIMFLTRYDAPNSWEGVGCDGGNWVRQYQRTDTPSGTTTWADLTSNGTTFKESDLNKTHHIRIEYQGKKVTIKDGETVVYNQEIQDFTDTTPRIVGIRIWGDSKSVFSIDNVKTGALTQEPAPETTTQPTTPPTTQPETPQHVDSVGFTNDTDRGGWVKEESTNNPGTITFTDGEGANGYMLLDSSNTSGTTYFKFANATPRVNGYMQMDVTLNSVASTKAGRILFLTRYEGPNNWEGVGVDNGKWFRQYQRPDSGNTTTWADLTNDKGIFKEADKGTLHTIRVEYNGTNVKIKDNNTEVYNGNIEQFNDTNARVVGIRVWGDSQSSFKIDNVQIGDLKQEPTLNKDNITINQNSLANGIKLTLDTKDTTLSSITNNGVDLTSEQYTYNQETKELTITPAYLETIKDTANTVLTLRFADGQTKTFTININIPEPEVKYTRSFAQNHDGFVKVAGNGSIKQNEGSVSIEGNGGLFIDENSEVLKNQEIEFYFNPKNYAQGEGNKYGVVLRYQDPSNYVYVGPRDQNNQHFTYWAISGPNNNSLRNINDQGFILAGRETPYKVKVRVVENVVTIFVDNEEIFSQEINGITMNPGKVGFKTNGNSGMTITEFTQSNAAFPTQAVGEVTTTDITNGNMIVKLDNAYPRVVEYTLDGTVVKGQEVAISQIEINNKLYTPTITSEIAGDKGVYHVTEPVTGITFDVVMVVKDNVLTMTVENINDTTTKLYTLNFPQHSLVSMKSTEPNGKLTVNNYQGQNTVNLNRNASKGYEETTLAVLSSDNYAAAISGESYKNRHEVAYQTFQMDGYKSTGLWLNEFTYRGLDDQVMIEKPWVKVSITKDRNHDNKIDLQDGAIALRDDCYKRKVGADFVTSAWTTIAMNVGSEAQYPFIRILDNAKKLSLLMDGFNQNLIIKGYQGEGHDSMHPDYANYNKRAGGLNDFLTLLDEAEKYNAKIGIHVNHTDVYPEAPQYDKIASKDAPAWVWYDSSNMVIRENDGLDKTATGMDARFEQLYVTDTQNKIDSTYVDVFFGTRWPLYNLVKNIAQRGVILGTENSDEMVSHSVFSHGVQTGEGHYKGPNNLVRFVENNQSDIFSKDNLFRGVATRNNGGDSPDKGSSGIYGWQQSSGGNNPASLYEAVKTFYTLILPQKFLAQYPLMVYENNNEAKLGLNNEVVTRWTNNKNIITLNGETVADGNKVFIPWANGNDKLGKIYHYNQDGTSSTWVLPEGWDGTNIHMYELTTKGKVEVSAPQVQEVNGKKQVTLTVKANTPYVLYKGTSTEINVANEQWSVGSLVKDMGFDSYSFNTWKKESTAANTNHIVIEDNNLGNAHLYIKGTNDGKVTQTITGLTKGKTYSASVWCITDSGRKASIEVVDGTQTHTNYMTSSDVRYGLHHNDKYRTNAQRMQVRFEAQSDTVTLILSADKGKNNDSRVDFDDVRIMEVGVSYNPKNYTYFEDFENVDQGFGLFVSEESDKSHLSQRNTQNSKYTPDVIDGNFSLKVRKGPNDGSYYGDVMRTIPSTVRFKADKNYTVGFEYKVLSGGFKYSIKSGSQTIVQPTNVTGEGKVEFKFTNINSEDTYLEIRANGDGNEYAIDNFYVMEAKEITYDTLQELIAEAEKLDSTLYTKESFGKVNTALTAAKAITKQSSIEEVKQAYTALDNAIFELVPYATNEDKAKLQSVIDQMSSLPEGDYHKDDKWLAFQSKIEEAKAAVKSDTLTQAEANKLIQEMNDAKNALNPTVDRTALKAIMAKAQRVNTESVMDGADLGSFLAAFELAKQKDMTPGVTKEEIDSATKGLEDTYAKLVFKDGHKNQYVGQELDKIAQADKNYFFENDWKVIQDANTRLNEMKNSSKVNVKEFYEIVDALDAALANKSKHPVVPAYQEITIDSSKVTVNNNQNGHPISNAFDNKHDTIWHTSWSPMFGLSESKPAVVEIDLGKNTLVSQFKYLPRQDSQENGNIGKYRISVKADGASEWTLVASGDQLTQNRRDYNTVQLDEVGHMARYVKFEALTGKADNSGMHANAAEIKLMTKTSDFSALQQLMVKVDQLDQSKYLNTYTKELNEVYNTAVELLNNPLTAQKVIDEKTAALQGAYDQLLTLATKDDAKLLENALVEAGKVNVDNYKDAKAFEEAKKQAQSIASRYTKGEVVSHTEMVDALVTLVNAQKALEPKPEVTPTPTPNPTDKPETSPQPTDKPTVKPTEKPESTVKPTVKPEPTKKPVANGNGGYDDGGPFTTDECGSIYDRWGNLMWKAPTCKAQASDGYGIVNTQDK